MQKITLIATGAAYGSESLFNSLRLAIALCDQQPRPDLRIFLMSDAVTAALAGQHDGADKTDHQGQIKADEYAQHQASQPARTNK